MPIFKRISVKALVSLIVLYAGFLTVIALWPFSFENYNSKIFTVVNTHSESGKCVKAAYQEKHNFLLMGNKFENPLSADNINDYILNFFGFIPLGYLLGSFLAKQKGRPLFVSISFCAFLIPVMLSLLFEYVQLYIPGRVSEISDLILNSAGGIIGIIPGIMEKQHSN
jgi:VanZ family protein